MGEEFRWPLHKISRRNAIHSGLGALVGLGALKSSELLAGPPMQRLAIIGGGMGGIASAYLCDEAWSVDLFEAREKIGGNADTVAFEHGGRNIAVDLGAEFFTPETHPLYWTLLEEIGGINSASGPSNILIDVPATLSIFDLKSQQPLFASQRPLDSILHAVSFAIYSQNARAFLDNDPSYAVTVREWVDGLWLDKNFKQKILLPWLASLTAGTQEQLSRSSLLSTLLLFARTFPENIFKKPKTYNASVGLEGILRILAESCQNLNLHLSSPVSRLVESDAGWYVETSKERFGPYAKVIVNAPPYAASKFLTQLPPPLLSLLARHEYFKARIVLHTDPIYMAKDKRYWAVQNAAVDGEFCEGSIWIGGTREAEEHGKHLQLFKSWATHRSVESQEIIAERTFWHPVDTPDMLQAIQDLQNWQGYKGLYFAGHFTTLTDLQETALYSAWQVAKVLNPHGYRLRSLEQRLLASGRSDIDYSVR